MSHFYHINCPSTVHFMISMILFPVCLSTDITNVLVYVSCVSPRIDARSVCVCMLCSQIPVTIGYQPTNQQTIMRPKCNDQIDPNQLDSVLMCTYIQHSSIFHDGWMIGNRTSATTTTHRTMVNGCLAVVATLV